jgi:hypothetical protein
MTQTEIEKLIKITLQNSIGESTSTLTAKLKNVLISNNVMKSSEIKDDVNFIVDDSIGGKLHVHIKTPTRLFEMSITQA